MVASPSKLAAELRRRLADAADPAKAGPMQAYMKSEMLYRGVPAPELKRICHEVFDRGEPLDGFDAWATAVLLLWRNATYREERYAAIALTERRRYDAYQTMKALPIYEEMMPRSSGRATAQPKGRSAARYGKVRGGGP